MRRNKREKKRQSCEKTTLRKIKRHTNTSWMVDTTKTKMLFNPMIYYRFSTAHSALSLIHWIWTTCYRTTRSKPYSLLWQKHHIFFLLHLWMDLVWAFFFILHLTNVSAKKRTKEKWKWERDNMTASRRYLEWVCLFVFVCACESDIVCAKNECVSAWNKGGGIQKKAYILCRLVWKWKFWPMSRNLSTYILKLNSSQKLCVRHSSKSDGMDSRQKGVNSLRVCSCITMDKVQLKSKSFIRQWTMKEDNLSPNAWQ